MAVEDTADFFVDAVGGLRSSVFPGEGLVCRGSGPSRAWIQTRSQDAFLAWLVP